MNIIAILTGVMICILLANGTRTADSNHIVEDLIGDELQEISQGSENQQEGYNDNNTTTRKGGLFSKIIPESETRDSNGGSGSDSSEAEVQTVYSSDSDENRSVPLFDSSLQIEINENELDVIFRNFDNIPSINLTRGPTYIGSTQRQNQVPYTGSTPIASSSNVPNTPRPGRLEVKITYNVTSIQEQEVNNILKYVARSTENSYIYYMSDIHLMPFLVFDKERMFSLDECYLAILKETYNDGDQWNIYYVLGQNSDEDTRLTAAEYAVMLNNGLKTFNVSFVYRKFEIFAFNNILRNAAVYLPRKDAISMYLVMKKDADIIAKKVPPNANFYKSNTCVVLLAFSNTGASKITRACGVEVDSAVQAIAEKLTNLISGDCSDNVQVTSESRIVSIELGIDATSQEDVDRKGPPELLMFLESEKNETIVLIPEKIEFLNNIACYMLDSKNYSGVFFWIGTAAPLRAQTTGIEKMENYINKDLKLPHIQVTIMQQWKETTDFKLNFSEWYT